MDDQQFPQAPHCDWEQFCRELPGMLHEMHEVVEAQVRIEDRMAGMDRRDENIATLVSALHQNQLALHGQSEAHARQLRKINDGLDALGVTPSGFVGLARDVGGSMRMTRRIWRALITVAGGAAALYGAFHLGESKGAPAVPDAPQEQAPRADE